MLLWYEIESNILTATGSLIERKTNGRFHAFPEIQTGRLLSKVSLCMFDTANIIEGYHKTRGHF